MDDDRINDIISRTHRVNDPMTVAAIRRQIGPSIDFGSSGLDQVLETRYRFIMAHASRERWIAEAAKLYSSDSDLDPDYARRVAEALYLVKGMNMSALEAVAWDLLDSPNPVITID